MTDTTITRPAVFRTITLIERDGSTVQHVPLDSESGRRHCWDVHLGVGFAPEVAGAALTFEDDPVVLVVINAMVPHRFWEQAAEDLAEHHREGTRSVPGLDTAGHSYWMTWANMPEAWKDGPR